jgi:two-component system response regulator MprA
MARVTVRTISRIRATLTIRPSREREALSHRPLTVHRQNARVNERRGRILVVDDDRAVRESLVRALDLEGYDVVSTNDGAKALDLLRTDSPDRVEPDVIVLDVMMPVVDGLTVCRVLRSEKNRVPVLMLTARTETSDRVAGLDAGADDYLSKPFALEELLARVRALLRRSRPDADESPAETLTLDTLRIDPAARRVWRGSVEIELSKTEFDLLELLVRNSGIVLDHSTIYERIWGYDFGPDSKNLAVYIGYIRRKIDLDGEKRLIQTVRGIGYSARPS